MFIIFENQKHLQQHYGYVKHY